VTGRNVKVSISLELCKVYAEFSLTKQLLSQGSEHDPQTMKEMICERYVWLRTNKSS
jgi:hypothetical protein